MVKLIIAINERAKLKGSVLVLDQSSNKQVFSSKLVVDPKPDYELLEEISTNKDGIGVYRFLGTGTARECNDAKRFEPIPRYVRERIPKSVNASVRRAKSPFRPRKRVRRNPRSPSPTARSPSRSRSRSPVNVGAGPSSENRSISDDDPINLLPESSSRETVDIYALSDENVPANTPPARSPARGNRSSSRSSARRSASPVYPEHEDEAEFVLPIRQQLTAQHVFSEAAKLHRWNIDLEQFKRNCDSNQATIFATILTLFNNVNQNTIPIHGSIERDWGTRGFNIISYQALKENNPRDDLSYQLFFYNELEPKTDDDFSRLVSACYDFMSQFGGIGNNQGGDNNNKRTSNNSNNHLINNNTNGVPSSSTTPSPSTVSPSTSSTVSSSSPSSSSTTTTTSSTSSAVNNKSSGVNDNESTIKSDNSNLKQTADSYLNQQQLNLSNQKAISYNVN